MSKITTDKLAEVAETTATELRYNALNLIRNISFGEDIAIILEKCATELRNRDNELKSLHDLAFNVGTGGKLRPWVTPEQSQEVAMIGRYIEMISNENVKLKTAFIDAYKILNGMLTDSQLDFRQPDGRTARERLNNYRDVLSLK